MPTKTPIAVAKAHMASKDKWIVYRVLKMQITLGTALYMLWSTDDQKQNPTKTVVGNVRVGLLVSFVGGVHVFVFKDNCIRKVRACDVAKVIEVSNGIFNSGLAVHRNDRSLANVEPVPLDDTTEEDGGVDEGASEEESKASSSEDESKASSSEEDDVDDRSPGLQQEHGKVTTPAIAVQEPVVPSSSEEQTSTNVTTTIGGTEEQTSTNVTTTTVGTAQDDVIEPTGVKPPTKDGAVENTAHGPLHNPPPQPTKDGAVEDTAHGPLHNPPPPPERPVDDVCSTLPDTLRELRAMETLVKEKKKAIRTLKKQQTDTNDKKAQKKRLEEQLKAIKTEVKAEKAKAKQDVVPRPRLKRQRGEEDDDDIDGDDDDSWLFSRPEKRVLNAIDKWQKGHRRAALSAATNKIVESVTVDTWEAAYEKLCDQGWAVVNNFGDLMHPACRPDADMRDYILDCKCTTISVL